MAISDKRFQFHLSTAVLAMFVIALLIPLNVCRNSPRLWRGFLYGQETTYDYGIYGAVRQERIEPVRYGWPLLAYPSHVADLITKPDGTQFTGIASTDKWNYGCVFGDILFGLLIVYVAVRIWETRLRRREGRKQ